MLALRWVGDPMAPRTGSWIYERTAEEVAAQIRQVYLPRTDPTIEDEWTKGWRAAVMAVSEFVESDGE